MNLSARYCVFAALLSAVSCNGKGDATADTISVSPAAAASQTPSPKRVDDCPATGQWALCSVEKRLRRSGFVATRIDSAVTERPGFSVKPVVYKLGSGRLEVFVYDDARAMEADIARIDTLTAAPPGGLSQWPSPPTLVRNANMAAVFMGQTARQSERLILALTAGAPSGG